MGGGHYDWGAYEVRVKLQSFCQTQNAGETPKEDNTRDDEEKSREKRVAELELFHMFEVNSASLWCAAVSLPAAVAQLAGTVWMPRCSTPIPVLTRSDASGKATYLQVGRSRWP